MQLKWTQHYENTPIQIYRKLHIQKLKIFRYKTLIFFTFVLCIIFQPLFSIKPPKMCISIFDYLNSFEQYTWHFATHFYGAFLISIFFSISVASLMNLKLHICIDYVYLTTVSIQFTVSRKNNKTITFCHLKLFIFCSHKKVPLY